MKRPLLFPSFILSFILPVIALLVIAPPSAVAGGYVALGGGSGGTADTESISVEFGGYLPEGEHRALFAIGVGFTLDKNTIPDDLLDYPVPHNDFTSLGTRESDEVYMYAKYGVEVVRESSLFLFFLGGAAWHEEIDLAQSNITGWLYEQSSSEEYDFILGGGLGFFPSRSPFGFQVEYDNRRGVTGSVALRY